MRIRWTHAAATDLESINTHLRDHHPKYQHQTIRKLYDSISSLKSFPHRGRPGREEGTRETLFLPLPYIAVYRIRHDTIEVLRIYHAAQERS